MAKDAVLGIWKRRSALNLVGAHINIMDGTWVQKDAGIGGAPPPPLPRVCVLVRVRARGRACVCSPADLRHA